MAWEKVQIHHNEVIYMGHAQGTMFSIPCSSGLGVGDSFKVNNKEYKITSALDVADRNEILLINATEVKDDEPETRRTADKSE
jgi:hypothetical protein